MKHGFIKAAACTPELTVGATDYNLTEIKKCISAAYAKKSEIIAFGQNALTGSTLGSMINYNQILLGAADALKELAAFSKNIPSVIIIGLPLLINGAAVSSAAVISSGKILGIVIEKNDTVRHKNNENCTVKLLDNYYTVSYDTVFEAENLGFKFGVCIGEDFDALTPASEDLALSGVDLIINISSGKALIYSYENRINSICNISSRLKCGYLYVSTGNNESVAKNVFCGDKIACENGLFLCGKEGGTEESIVYAEFDTELVKNLKQMISREYKSAKNISVFTLKNLNGDVTRNIERLPFVPPSVEFDRILDIMGRGIITRMKEAGTKKVIIGVSGGLDSTMVLIAAERMFSKYKLNIKDIIAVTMGGFGSSKRTSANAKKLIETFGVTHIDIDIVNAVKNHLADISHGGKKDIVYENAQARERTQILLDLSNMHNALMLGTGDLSEIALGWSTYGGDQLSQYNPNSSLSKTLIRAAMRHYSLTCSNEAAAGIVSDVLATPVSPELLPNQDTEEFLGPYELHDFFLYNLIGNGFSVSKVVYLAGLAFSDYSKKVIIKHLRTFIIRFFSNQFKRTSGSDGIQITEFDLTDKIIYSEFNPEQYLKELDLLEAKEAAPKSK